MHHANLFERDCQRSCVEVLDEVSPATDDALNGEGFACTNDPGDKYLKIPVTPDGQPWNEDLIAQVNPHQDPEQRRAMLNLLHEYGTIFADTPGCISTIEYDIVLNAGRIHVKSTRCPFL